MAPTDDASLPGPVLDYIADMLAQLADLAHVAQRPQLAVQLRMAALQAELPAWDARRPPRAA